MERSTKYIVWVGTIGILLTLAACGLQQSASQHGTPTGIPSDAPPPTVGTAGTTVQAGNTDGAETVLIPAGAFQMGSAAADTLAGQDELPAHQVTLGSFNIYTHEVTNAMYSACVKAGACPPVTELAAGPTAHTSEPAYAEYPVVGVTWNAAAAYCEWAGGRLPTEAEWEYTARGAESLLHPWGANAPTCSLANMSGCTSPADTAAVGSLAAGNSPFGAWDMSGNVWEWTQDWYAPSFYAFSPAENPIGPSIPQDSANPLKTARGGSFYSAAAQMRSAARLGVNPYRAYNDVGFRCVAEAPLSLPEDYVETDTRFEVTGGDGQNVEDPGVPADSWYDIIHSSTTCMDDNGQIHIEITIQVTPGTTFALSMENKPFTCIYDEASDTLKCDGPASSNYEEQHKTIMLLQLFFPNGESLDIDWYNIPIPDDCTVGQLNVGESSVTVGCPVGGSVTATFTYDPGITWKNVYLRSMDTPLPCEVTGEGVLNCVAPDISEDGFYEFYLEDEGPSHKWWPDAPAPANCPADTGNMAIGFETLCFLGVTPTVEFFYDPGLHGSVKTVQDAGEYRLHVNWSAGVTESMFTDETPGHVTTMTLCFQDDFCMDVPDITVPACPSGGGETEHGYTLEPGCYAPGEEVVFDPAVNIHYLPDNHEVVSASANGAPLTCHLVIDGWTNCSILPGAVGDSAAINFCFADGKCYDGTTTVKACPNGEPSEWSFVSSGCHNTLDGGYVFFMLDTGYDWLTPQADVTYSATDGARTFACVTHPTKTGQIYCYGPKPGQAGTMNVCIQRPGQAQDCRSFPDYYSWVSALSCPAFTCNGLGQASCTADSRCQWVTPPVGPAPKPAYCTSK